MIQKPAKIAVLIPVYSTVPAQCFSNILHFALDSLKLFPLSISTVESTYITRARNILIENFLNSTADYALFVDSDMILPKDTIAGLLAHEKDVISAYYIRRTPPHVSVALKKMGGKYETIMNPSEGDEFEADITGMGCMLVKREVIEKVSEKKPVFTVNDNSDSSVKGEDAIFCEKIREAGYKIWVSKKVIAGHFGGILVPKNF